MEYGSRIILKISVIIPSYNGWNRLCELCIKIEKVLRKNVGLDDFEIIIVDDGSKKRPDKQIMELRNMGIDVKGILLKKNYGQQLATIAGLRNATGDYSITLDDDFSHKPEDLYSLISALEKKNFDIVYGIPGNAGSGLLRNIGSDLRDTIFNIFFNKPKGTSVSSFRILNRSLVENILHNLSEYRYLSVEVLKHTKAIGNIQVEYNREPGTGSRYSFVKLVKLAFSIIRCSRFFPEWVRVTNSVFEMEWDII